MKKHHIMIGFGLVLAAALIFYKGEAIVLIEQVLKEVKSLGIQGVVLYCMVYVLATVLFIPGSIITLAAGVLYGVVWGTVYVSIASTIGATLAFWISRTLLYDWALQKSEQYTRWKAFQGLLKKNGFKVTFLLRLSPVIPFNAMNYLMGVSHVKTKDYILGSWLGMIPGTVLYVYIGSLLSTLTNVFTGQTTEQALSLQKGLLIGGFVVTLVLVVYISKMAKKALQEKVDTE